MRLVAKTPGSIPPVLQPLSKLELDQIAGGDYTPIKDRVYKGTYKDANGKTQSTVRDALNIFYHKKCAYCERICKAEIEHYRPKKAVLEDATHKGYYWLCYEWSNLVPSCRYCNTEGGKGNQFPILAGRIYNPEFIGNSLNNASCHASQNPLLSEQPLLLHPEIDDPKGHFTFKLDDEGLGIEIVGIGAGGRGATTIRICNLNRYEVVLNRKEAVILPLIKGIDQVFEQVADGILPIENTMKALRIVFTQLQKEISDDTLTHTLLRWYIHASTANFERIIVTRIENEDQKEVVLKAFAAYKLGNL